ncbi:MAG: extracellular solute-binding protein [Candidatus Omnitrophota bacterium]|jgi:ABC-type glycerol-3-phosphate transport system substrate-binding protein
MKLNKFSALFFIGALFLAAGCGKREDASSGAAAKSQPQEVLMWLVGSESQAKVVQEIGSDFFKNKNIAFRCEAISWGDAHTKYLTCIAGGVVPDIGMMGLTWGTEFGSLGAMVDLAREFPPDIKIIKEKNFPGLWHSVEHKGSVYGIPFDLSIQVMFYRNDIIPRPPRTWQELERQLLELRAKGKGMIFDWGSMSWIGYSPFLWQAGGDFYNQEGTKSALGSAQASQALAFFSRLYRELGVSEAQIPLEQGMRTGDFPLAISGNWKIDSLRLSAPEIKGKWSIAMLPAGPTAKRTAFFGGRIMVIFGKSRHKQASWELIKYLFEPQVQAKLYEAARNAQDSYLPSNVATWDILPLEREFKQVLKAQAEDALGPPSVLGWDGNTRFIEEAIQRVVLQGKAPADELAKVVREMDK